MARHTRTKARIAWLLAVALVALCAAPAKVRACNEVVLRDKCYSPAPTVSARTFSFPTALSPEIAWARKGANLTFLDVALNTPPPAGRHQASKHDFVCVTHARPEFKALYPNDAVGQDMAMLVCSDGINDAGLSAALLYEFETTALPKYDKDSKQRDAINVMNLATWALANAGTVAELKQKLRGLQVTWNPAYNTFGRAFAFGRYDHAPIHFSFSDRSGGKGAIVEWRDGAIDVVDNEYGVFANSKLYRENLVSTQAWLDKMYANPRGAYPSVKDGAEQTRASSEPAEKGERRAVTFWAPPGDWASQSRFTRLAMVLNATAATCYSAKSAVVKGAVERTNPDFVPPGLPATNPSLLSVLQVLNTVYLPRGIDDDSLAFDAEEFTPLSMLRDHGRDAAANTPAVAPVYYYRTANSLQYKAIDLGRVEWAKLGAKGVRRAPAVFSPQPWFTPASNEWAAHPAAR